MPLKLNLDVGSKTWLFNADRPDVGPGLGTRGGGFEPYVPKALRPPEERYDLNYAYLESEGVDPASVIGMDRKTQAMEAIELQRQRRELEEERRRLDELGEQQRRELKEERIRLDEQGQQNMAEEELQKQLEEDYMETGKQKMLEEADARLQQIREEVAALEDSYAAKVAHVSERERRAAQFEAEAEERARQREEMEAARAAQMAADLQAERQAALDQLKKDAMDEYRRTHEEMRLAQQAQLQQELEVGRLKIAAEAEARKEALELERERMISNLRAEIQAEYRIHLDEQRKMDDERAAALERHRNEAALEAKRQQHEALMRLYGAAGQRLPSRAGSKTPTADDRAKMEQLTPLQRQRLLLQRRAESLRNGNGMFAGDSRFATMPTPGPYLPADYPPRGPPISRPPVVGVSPTSTWGQPTPRQRSASFSGSPAPEQLRRPPEPPRRGVPLRPGVPRRVPDRPPAQPLARNAFSDLPGRVPPPPGFIPPGSNRMEGLAYAATPRTAATGGWGAPSQPAPITRSTSAAPARRGAAAAPAPTSRPVPPASAAPVNNVMVSNSASAPLAARTGPSGSMAARPSSPAPVPKVTTDKASTKAKDAATPARHPMRAEVSYPAAPIPLKAAPAPAPSTALSPVENAPEFVAITGDSVPGFKVHKYLVQTSGACIRTRPTGPLTPAKRDAFDVESLNARRKAMGRMIQEARRLGGNGVVGLKWEHTIIADDQIETSVYGTAVYLVPESIQPSVISLEDSSHSAHSQPVESRPGQVQESEEPSHAEAEADDKTMLEPVPSTIKQDVKKTKALGSTKKVVSETATKPEEVVEKVLSDKTKIKETSSKAKKTSGTAKSSTKADEKAKVPPTAPESPDNRDRKYGLKSESAAFGNGSQSFNRSHGVGPSTAWNSHVPQSASSVSRDESRRDSGLGTPFNTWHTDTARQTIHQSFDMPGLEQDTISEGDESEPFEPNADPLLGGDKEDINVNSEEEAAEDFASANPWGRKIANTTPMPTKKKGKKANISTAAEAVHAEGNEDDNEHGSGSGDDDAGGNGEVTFFAAKGGRKKDKKKQNVPIVSGSQNDDGDDDDLSGAFTIKLPNDDTNDDNNTQNAEPSTATTATKEPDIKDWASNKSGKAKKKKR